MKYLGNRDKDKFTGLDTFEVSRALEVVNLMSEELATQCPVTGHVDIYKIIITYSPDKLALETKSLKMYFETLRGLGIFAENLAVKIANDLDEVLKCHWLTVTLTQNIRGGIVIGVTASHLNEEDLDNKEWLSATLNSSSGGT